MRLGARNRKNIKNPTQLFCKTFNLRILALLVAFYFKTYILEVFELASLYLHEIEIHDVTKPLL